MRHKIVEEARSWLNTPFCHQGRLKPSENFEGACDCLGLVIGVSKALNLKTRDGELFHLLDYIQYSSIPDSKKLSSEISKHLTRVEYPSAGDLALLSFVGQPQHLAIIGSQSCYCREYQDIENSCNGLLVIAKSECDVAISCNIEGDYYARQPIACSDDVVLKDSVYSQSLQGVQRHDNLKQHSEYLTLIHAYYPLGKVCEHIFNKKWQRRVVAFYSFSF